MTTLDSESPRVLDNGQWVRDRVAGVLRWHPNPDRRHPHWFVACDKCGADVGDVCREPAGRQARSPHARRIEAFRHFAASTLSPTKGGTP